ncbi:MAG TPA: glycerol kinase [Clostridiales bacterium]|mgnify:CR=1 FL=1|nr:glycerol kinase GlpK [Clostridia bacterium]HCS72931.1 glycerol kinase [Clostridiales bacterium]
MKKIILALDQGTTSCRAILFDHSGNMLGEASAQEFRQIYPKPGWVEHDPEEIWQCQLQVIRNVLKANNKTAGEIAAIGITNQRETIVLWDRLTGKPVDNAIVWQCRRTARICEDLKAMGLEETIRKKTGLVIDAYFSGTKIKWLLDKHPGLRERAERGEILAGTMDSWLIWKLTGGAGHFTDYSNASRTMIYNIHELCWDEELLRILDIPLALLPEVKPSSAYFGASSPELFGEAIPITGAAGDQQSALFGQACFDKGSVKNTYGTGCFLLMNTGEQGILSPHKLLTTIAWGIGGKVEYALEGSVFVAGAAVQWLRDEMGLIKTAAESEELAGSVPDTQGVLMVPAFVGLGAPYWDMYARGSIFGITRGVNRKHIVRAVLESIAYQTRDVLSVMEEDSGISISRLKVDGGASANKFLMQFQSDILGVEVAQPANLETTALGAAFLAGLELGVWKDKQEISDIWHMGRKFTPIMAKEERNSLYMQWKKAVNSCQSF